MSLSLKLNLYGELWLESLSNEECDWISCNQDMNDDRMKLSLRIRLVVFNVRSLGEKVNMMWSCCVLFLSYTLRHEYARRYKVLSHRMILG